MWKVIQFSSVYFSSIKISWMFTTYNDSSVIEFQLWFLPYSKLSFNFESFFVFLIRQDLPKKSREKYKFEAWILHMLGVLHQIPDTAFYWLWPKEVWSIDHIPRIWRAAWAGKISYRVTEWCSQSHESHFQLGTDCKFLPSEWCFRWLWAVTKATRRSQESGSPQHHAWDPQS